MSVNSRFNPSDFSPASMGVSPVTLVKAIVGVVLAALVLSIPYALLEYHIPLVYLCALLPAGFGLVLGKVGQAMLRKFKISSKAAATVVGVVGGLIAVWLAWPAYFFVIANEGVSAYFTSLLNPVRMFTWIYYLGHDPVWSISKSGPFPAVVYYLFWLVELCAVPGVAAFYCRDFVANNKLCGKCGEWLKDTGDNAAFSFPAEPDPTLLGALSGGDVQPLLRLARRPAEGDEATEWLEVKGFACADCEDEDSYVNVLLVTLVYNKKSKEYDRSEKPLAQFVPVDVETERRIFETPQQVAGGGAAPVEDAPADAESAARE